MMLPLIKSFLLAHRNQPSKTSHSFYLLFIISYCLHIFFLIYFYACFFFNTPISMAPIQGLSCNFYWGMCCLFYTEMHITYKKYATYIYLCIWFKLECLSIYMYLYPVFIFSNFLKILTLYPVLKNVRK